jgi:hypothetical protein
MRLSIGRESLLEGVPHFCSLSSSARLCIGVWPDSIENDDEALRMLHRPRGTFGLRTKICGGRRPFRIGDMPTLILDSGFLGALGPPIYSNCIIVFI